MNNSFSHALKKMAAGKEIENEPVENDTVEAVMPSFIEECSAAKEKYDACFNSWFKNSFLQGKSNHEEVCGTLFSEYQKCIKVLRAIS